MMHPQILRDISLFVEVAKRRSFSQAARALDMPISSLSRRVTLFEAAIGVRLLDRTTRKITLTSYGEAYLSQAARLVEEAERSFDELVSRAKGPSGLLKIVAPPEHWVVRHLSGVIADFSDEHDQVQVHIDLRPAPFDLLGDNYDLAISIAAPQESSLIVRKIADVENGLYASTRYLAANGRPETPIDLRTHRVILSMQSKNAEWLLSKAETSVTVTVVGQISCNNSSLARQFAKTGRGIAIANRLQVGDDVSNGNLERVLPHWRPPATPIYVVTASRLLPAKTRSFIDFVSKRLSQVLAVADGLPAGKGRTEAPG